MCIYIYILYVYVDYIIVIIMIIILIITMIMNLPVVALADECRAPLPARALYCYEMALGYSVVYHATFYDSIV